MSDQSVHVTYAEALETFEQAYAAFLAAFEQASDAALAYVPPGDAYSLGILPLHLQDQIQDYMALLQDMLKADFAALDRSQDTERETRTANRYAYLAEQRPTGADRAAILAELAAVHREAHKRLTALDEATATRTAPVIYSVGTAPYPTSARAIIGWLQDHYQEHTKQTQDMLAQWRAEQHG
jgi:hypothetical protein